MSEKQIIINNTESETLVSKQLYASDFYHIKHWRYDLLRHQQRMPGYNDCLCMMYVKKGHYLSDFTVTTHDMHSGYLLIEKPDCEYTMKPSAGESTIINFSNDFYSEALHEMDIKPSFFFLNNSMLSVILKSNTDIDYLHHQITAKLHEAGKLEIDNLVMEFFNSTVSIIANKSLEEEVNALLKINRLPAVELAKEYMHKNFVNDISLQEVAANSFISPFHFSRIFKRLTNYSPHQYLQNIRLKHSEMLIKNSSLTISEIAYAAGFASIAYFSTAFKKKYKMNPQQYRGSI